MGTVWLRLHPSQEYIQPFINAIVSPPLIHDTKIHSLIKIVLRFCFYVFHGCSLRPSIPRRPGNLRKRES